MPKDYHLHLRGPVGDWKFDSEYTSYILDKYKDQEVNVLISSLGGRADSGLTINSLLKIHGNVHVHFIGMNASAATIAAMGAKRITIDSGACFLVHKCLQVVFDWDWMNADQLEDRIKQLQQVKDDLNTLDSCIAGIYARRCKKSKDELLALMKVGGWLTPQQALEWGFVDEITDIAEDEKPVLTEAVASAMCSAGMPMPPIPIDKKDSFFDRLRKFFAGESGDKAGQPDSQTNNHHTQSSMKNFTLLSAILGCALAASGSKAELTEDQLDKVEASLSAKDSEIADLKKQLESKDSEIADLNTTVTDLKKAPADESKDIKETSASMDTDGPGEDIDSVVADLAKAFLS